MATQLSSASIKASVSWSYDNILAYGNATAASSFSYSKSTTDGTGAAKANKIYIAQATIGAGGTLSIDVAGSLTDIYGNLITMTKVKAIYFELTTDTTASSVAVGGAASNAFINWVGDATDVIRVRNGGCFFLGCNDATGYAVTAGTGDILLITNEDGSNVATYKLCLIGE